ncbi:hypothetical protein [Pontivivens insulae]|uniref:Uncharacterized protein n=1 Tax=Pontivivens insulae TaxID=1639689 RepID=A0A2R8ABA6_9RHOB|nr:hypothetical protein [Pontivivens insulae]RED13238.1 hypothetical protein DFR53_2374 [Pontivivens insulae]SPF29330.1 hypothetical protein POI8812_01638 [Pontivivens insulae]
MAERKIPPDFRIHLNQWNAGTSAPPVTPEAYSEMMGNYWLAVGYADLFWPDFQLVDGLILRPGLDAGSIDAWRAQLTEPAAIEQMLNHIHISDIHMNALSEGEVTVESCIYLGEVLAEMYAAKLALQFPDRPCEVEFYRPDDFDDIIGYQITFWQRS